jgi:hypothetical protein
VLNSYVIHIRTGSNFCCTYLNCSSRYITPYAHSHTHNQRQLAVLALILEVWKPWFNPLEFFEQHREHISGSKRISRSKAYYVVNVAIFVSSPMITKLRKQQEVPMHLSLSSTSINSVHGAQSGITLEKHSLKVLLLSLPDMLRTPKQ